MEYYFDELDPVKFQRLINAILVCRFGEDARITPLRGKDGGRDAETAPHNPYFEYVVQEQQSQSIAPLSTSPRAGRYLFQVKHHKTSEMSQTEARKRAISEFATQLRDNVLTRKGEEKVNYFFLVTNANSSRSALDSIDTICQEQLRGTPALHADIWWKETVTAYLDQMPQIWAAFPEILAGGKVPPFANISNEAAVGDGRTLRLALSAQFSRDSYIKFRQIDLTRDLVKLFVDLKLDVEHLERGVYDMILSEAEEPSAKLGRFFSANEQEYSQDSSDTQDKVISATHFLLSEVRKCPRKILLQGGPGQGKSTLTQMAAQIYRGNLLGKKGLPVPGKARLPFRIDLRSFSEFLAKGSVGSVEGYIVSQIREDSGTRTISVEALHDLLSTNPVAIFLDGLDEVGSSSARLAVISAIEDFSARCEGDLNVDLKLVLTTRPPAIVGYQDRLPGFKSITIASMDRETRERYMGRWLMAHVPDEENEQERIRHAFLQRQDDAHVKGLSRNPMQLAVLLHFIRLKGEAFPERRADLYKAYFDTVIDRDVEKSPELRDKREIVETLHQFLAFKIHSLTETQELDGTIGIKYLNDLVSEWLREQSGSAESADELFRLGHERLGLIVALRGEGDDTRYGFEVQPTREYFAAAYVNEQGSDDTTQIFAEMIRRPFWFEIGMFLAGLRRFNERADLLVCLKGLDDDEEHGWRQDGRLAVFELLREGVLSLPRWVYTDALEYVIGFFDSNVDAPNRLDYSRRELFYELVDSTKSDRVLHRVRRTIDVEHPEVDAVGLAAAVLPKDEAVDSLLRSPFSPAAQLHMAIDNEVPLNRLVSDERFWEAPKSAIARALWRNRLWQHENEIAFPSEVQQWLIYSAAFYPEAFTTWTFWHNKRKSARSKFIPEAQNCPAAHALANNLTAIHTVTLFELESAERVALEEYTTSRINLRTAGLTTSSARAAKTLFNFTRDVLRRRVTGDGTEIDAVERYARTLGSLLDGEATISWLTLRVLRYVLVTGVRRPTRTSIHRRLAREIQGRPKVEELWEKAQSFFAVDYFGNASSLKQQLRVWDLVRLPSLLRLNADDDLVPLGSLVMDCIDKGERLPQPLSEHLDVPMEIWIGLLSEQPGKAELILSADFRVSFGPYRDRMSATIRSLCLRLVKQTESDDVANAALGILLRDRLEGRMRIKSTLPRLLELQRGAVLLRKAFHFVPRARHVSDAEISELQEVAWNLRNNKYRRAPKWLIREAASFLIATVPQNMSPLIEVQGQKSLHRAHGG